MKGYRLSVWDHRAGHPEAKDIEVFWDQLPCVLTSFYWSPADTAKRYSAISYLIPRLSADELRDFVSEVAYACVIARHDPRQDLVVFPLSEPVDVKVHDIIWYAGSHLFKQISKWDSYGPCDALVHVNNDPVIDPYDIIGNLKKIDAIYETDVSELLKAV